MRPYGLEPHLPATFCAHCRALSRMGAIPPLDPPPIPEGSALPPRSHRTDPPASKAAEVEARHTFLSGHLRVVMDAVRWSPGRTSSELADGEVVTKSGRFAAPAHQRLYQVRRRLSDLMAMDLVVRADTVPESRWWPSMMDGQRVVPSRFLL